MTEIVNWETNQIPNDPTTPSFRFSLYFMETRGNISPKITGVWLKSIDTDTIKFFCETLLNIDRASKDDRINYDDETRKDMTDLLYLTILLWQWETGKIWNYDTINTEAHHLHAEYLFRLSRLVLYEFLHRTGGESSNGMLEQDEAQYHGRLAIFEETV